jgi:N-acetyl-anhydromuramyl-L-alanine amidase AmpD
MNSHVYLCLMRKGWLSFLLVTSFLLGQAAKYPPNPYQNLMADVYARHPQVPKGLLEAVAWRESRFSPLIPAEPSCMGIPQGWGLFGWIEDGRGYFRENLRLIAEKTGFPISELKTNPALQAEAFARAYETYCQEKRLPPKSPESVKNFLIAISYLPLPEDPLNDFALQSELFETFRFLTDPEAAAQYHFPKWEISLQDFFGKNYSLLAFSPVRIIGEEVQTVDGTPFQRTNNADYSGAIWDPAPSCNYSSRNGTSITHVTLHTVQGTYAGCISWFKNCNAQVSAHYVIRSSDGQITQMVREADKAWHVGTENPYTIGIEHEGYINNPSWYTTAMYHASAALVRNICQRRGIPRNSTWFGDACTGSTSACLVKSCIRIKAHQQYPNQTHTDVGPHWDWNRYYQLVAGPTYTIQQTLTAASGTVYDPGGPSGDYSNNQRYFIKIAPPGATSITLTFQQFSLENNFSASTKGGDYLYIYDGDTTTAPLLRRLTGTSLPNPVTSTGGTVLLELRTDCSNPMAGWQLSYTANINAGTSDNIPPTTAIGPAPDWVTQNFSLAFTDNDNVGVEKAFYLVMYDSAGDWRANAERGFFSDNFVGPALHPEWTSHVGTWLIFDPGNGDPVLRQTDESISNTNLYAYLRQNLSNRYLYHWAGRFVRDTSNNCRMGLHIFADDPTLSDRGNSYFVFFRLQGQKVQLYKVVNNSWGSGPVAQVTYPFQDGVWYDFKWSYDRITGDHRIYVNNQLVLSWKDPTPIQSGSYISLRTGNARVEYNNFKVYRSRPINGSVTIRVGPNNNDDIRRQSDYPTHYVGRIRSIVQDSAGNLSSTPARDVRVDWTPPVPPPYVYDGSDFLQDQDTLYQDTLLLGSWGSATDPHSGLTEYQYTLSTAVGDSNVISWTSTAQTSFLAERLSSGTLQRGTRYYIGIRARNGANLLSPPTYSDGFVYDVVSTGFSAPRIQVLLAPNPSVGASYIYFLGHLAGPVEVQVLDPLGRTLWRTLTQEFRLQLPELPKGTYLIRIQGPYAVPTTLRWIVTGS